MSTPNAPVEAGTEQVLIAKVVGCVSHCTFTWFIEGKDVARTTADVSPGQGLRVGLAFGSSGALRFDAQSSIVQSFTPGRHLVTVRSVDAAGNILWTTTTVIAIQTALPETDTLGLDPARPSSGAFLILIGLSMVALAFVIATRRRRRQER